MTLPKPVWSGDDITMAQDEMRNSSGLILRASGTWNKDPTKIVVLRAIISCLVRIGYFGYFGWDMGKVLAQDLVCFLLIGSGGSALLNSLQSISDSFPLFLTLSSRPDLWRSPVSHIPEENHEAS